MQPLPPVSSVPCTCWSTCHQARQPPAPFGMRRHARHGRAGRPSAAGAGPAPQQQETSLHHIIGMCVAAGLDAARCRAGGPMQLRLAQWLLPCWPLCTQGAPRAAPCGQQLGAITQRGTAPSTHRAAAMQLPPLSSVSPRSTARQPPPTAHQTLDVVGRTNTVPGHPSCCSRCRAACLPTAAGAGAPGPGPPASWPPCPCSWLGSSAMSNRASVPPGWGRRARAEAGTMEPDCSTTPARTRQHCQAGMQGITSWLPVHLSS